MNYIIAFHVTLPCRAPGAPEKSLDQELLAQIFVPLPTTNAAPEVTSVSKIN